MGSFTKWAGGVFVGTSLALLVAGVLGAFASPQKETRRATVVAHANIVGGSLFPDIRGTVSFVQTGTGPMSPVQVVASVTGLPPGLHGIHIHETGNCTPSSTFAGAGGHFDPGPMSDPSLANHPFHAGDLPNLDAGPGGIAILVYLHDSRITLDAGPSGIFGTGPGTGGAGSAIVIHAGPDLYTTNAGGARIACGVIQPN